MKIITLGKTNLKVNKNGFGALPIQRITEKEAVYLLHKAYDNGINFYDTARFYTDSEEKIGAAFADRRKKVIIASKTGATTVEDFWKDLHTTLKNLKTDYLDLYQFHNPAFCPKPGDGTGLYEAMLEARQQGKISHIGITNHRLAVAHEAIDSGLYETLQFPFSYLASDQEMALVEKCKANNLGFIAMKALAGGLINHAATAYAYIAQFPHVEPIRPYSPTRCAPALKKTALSCVAISAADADTASLAPRASRLRVATACTSSCAALRTTCTSQTSSTRKCNRQKNVCNAGNAAPSVPITSTPPTC